MLMPKVECGALKAGCRAWDDGAAVDDGRCAVRASAG